MKVGEAIKGVYEACQYNSEESDARNAMAEILREAGWHVAENESDLREEALAHTDLVEPSDES